MEPKAALPVPDPPLAAPGPCRPLQARARRSTLFGMRSLRAALAGLTCSLALAAPTASAQGREPRALEAEIGRSDAARPRAAFCTPLGCVARPSSSASAAAGFGLAVVAAGWLARRRRREPH